MSFVLRIDPKKRTSGRFIGEVRNALVKAVLAAEKTGITRADIARKIGCNRSRITRQLRGSSDLTLRSLAEIAWAIDMVPEFSLAEKDIVVQETNEVRTDWHNMYLDPTSVNATPKAATTGGLPMSLGRRMPLTIQRKITNTEWV